MIQVYSQDSAGLSGLFLWFAFITHLLIPAAPIRPGLLPGFCLPGKYRGWGISKFANPGATGCAIMTTMMRMRMMMMMVMTIIMVTITLVQFELGTSVCSSLGLIHDPTKQKITHKFSLHIPSRLFLYSMAHSLQSLKMERELHKYNILTP